MSINKYNHEGYNDPTVYEALTNIERTVFRPLVYICSPYAGDIDANVNNARRFCRFALKKNTIPLAPHLLFPQFIDDDNPSERELAMFMNMILLGKCSEIWVFGSTISKGMEQEIEKAMKRKQLIRYFKDNLQEVLE